MITGLLPYLQTFLAIGNLAIMLYALKTFLKKPHDTLESKVAIIEAKLHDIDCSLKAGKDRFREHDEAIEVLLTSLFALVEFEIAYVTSEDKPLSRDLEKAKDKLHEYLTKR